jgi:hypothetical protein
MGAEEKRQAREWFEAVVKKQRCVVCGADERTARSKGTRLQGHHILSQQSLRKYGHADKLWDARNGCAACEYPCHSQHTVAVRRIERSALPTPALEFAMELGLGYLLDRQYA